MSTSWNTEFEVGFFLNMRLSYTFVVISYYYWSVTTLFVTYFYQVLSCLLVILIKHHIYSDYLL